MWLFDFLFGKKKDIRPTTDHVSLNVSDWQITDACNGIEFAKICYRHGRYELAAQFKQIGIDWYHKYVVLATPKAERSSFREYLREYKAQLSQFPLLTNTRDAVLVVLEQHPDGLDRSELSLMVDHKADFKFAVVCNQLEKGGWIAQRRKGKKVLVLLPEQSAVSDIDFLRSVIPAPGSSGISI